MKSTKEQRLEEFDDRIIIEQPDSLSEGIQENGFSIHPSSNKFFIWGKSHSVSFSASKENCAKIIKVCSPDFDPKDIGERLDTSNIPGSCGTVQSFSDYVSFNVSSGKDLDICVGICIKKSDALSLVQDWLDCQ